jgi:outer membrane protein X
MLKAEYFLSESSARPFVGLGIGRYVLAGTAASGSGSASIGVGRHFGVMPQLGINLGSFRLAVAYNILVGKDEVSMGYGSVKEISRNYVGIDMGFRVGGKQQ